MELYLESVVNTALATKKTKIVCQVHNCVYNDGFCNCMKNEIDVGAFYARSEKDVACKSFTPRTW